MMWKLVDATFVRFARLLHVHVGGQLIRTTDEHPFYVYNKGWTPAGQLEIGDLLSSHDGTWVRVEDLLDTGEYDTVYNLRVADWHTYFVGGDGWGFSVWAHNTCTITANKAKGQAAEATILARLKGNKNVTVLGTQVRVKTPGNPNFRVTDIVVQNNRTGKVFVVEVKSGGAVVSGSQAAKDTSIGTGGTATNPTVFYGRSARAAGLIPPGAGSAPTGPIPTFIARVP